MPNAFRRFLYPLAVLLVAAGLSAARADSTDTTGFDRLNAHRKAAGLAPVELDAALAKGCQAHASYLAQNVSKPNLRTNDEDPALPGFSEEGRKAAQSGFSAFDRKDPAGPVDGWFASLFFRLLLLDPDLRRVGWGAAQDDKKNWIVVLDVLRGRGSSQVVVYPPDGLKDVPLVYPGTEFPDPIPQATRKVAGYPVTVTFPPIALVRDVTATLAHGKEDVAIWLSTPEKPAKDKVFQRNSVCLIAKEPLQANTKYTVAVKAQMDGAAWEQTWSFTTGAARLGKAADGTTVLERVNGCRKAAGLGPVKLDEALSKGCQAHADYLVQNASHPSTQDLGAHDEDPKLPGYSAEGRKAGQAADISFGTDPLASVDAWMATFFHRVPLLDPDLRRVGFGTARDRKQGPISVLDVQTGRGGDEPVVYPGDKQQDVPTTYLAGERPDPIPESKTKKAGFPITVTFPRNVAVKDAAATLTDDKGGEVACWLATPEKPIDADLQRNSIGLIAKEPLQAGTTYTVTVTAKVNGNPWKQTWTFTSAAK